MVKGAIVDIEGKRYIHVHRLRVPVAVALGLYERLSDKQLVEHAQDLQVEAERRGINDQIRR